VFDSQLEKDEVLFLHSMETDFGSNQRPVCWESEPLCPKAEIRACVWTFNSN